MTNPHADRGRQGRRAANALARTAWLEDRAAEDRTSRAVLPSTARARARLVAQATGVVSGIAAASRVAAIGGLRAHALLRDGDRVRPGVAVLELDGSARRILAVERSMLNLLMHASGVATATARAVRAAHGATPTLEIWATRKTLAGLRYLEKAAVVHGGGHPHRRDLSDGLLLKSTHLAFVPVETAIARVRRHARRGERVEVEVTNARGAVRAARAGADALLIDNATPAGARRIVAALAHAGVRPGLWIELSGGITPDRVALYRRAGANAMSLGALTHSARALPFHLEIEPVRLRRRAP